MGMRRHESAVDRALALIGPPRAEKRRCREFLERFIKLIAAEADAPPSPRIVRAQLAEAAKALRLANWPRVYRPFHHGRLARPLPLQRNASSDPQKVPISCGSRCVTFGVEQALSANRSRIRAPRHVIKAVFGHVPMIEEVQP